MIDIANHFSQTRDGVIHSTLEHGEFTFKVAVDSSGQIAVGDSAHRIRRLTDRQVADFH